MQLLIGTKNAAATLRNKLASHLWPTYTFDELGTECVRILKLDDGVKGLAIQRAVENFLRSHSEENATPARNYLSEYFFITVSSLSNFFPLEVRNRVEYGCYDDSDELIVVVVDDSMT